MDGIFNNKLGKRIDSKVMLATAADSLGDVITTSATVISIVICHFTSINVDAIAGLIVSGIVIWSGVSIAKDTLGATNWPTCSVRALSENNGYGGII